ncbi:hypothetical protein ACFFRR_001899 [Megaselia abdita]
MLKWAVNGTCRQSLQQLPTTTTLANKRHSLDNLLDTPTNRRVTKRKSSEHEMSLRKRIHKQNYCDEDKENFTTTSTPLPKSLRRSLHSPKLHGSLKDLSKITPDKFVITPVKTRAIFDDCMTPTPANPRPTKPSQYASTLPTFDVEYSPCNIVPGPILALRGMGVGIADSYFEKPMGRYLNSKKKLPTCPLPQEEESLSSSKMGDMTLERMIDAILESARKESKPTKPNHKLNTCQIMSPTYTAADDPASDLNEFWDTDSYIHSGSKTIMPATCRKYNEREVRTPKDDDDSDIFGNLKRQKAVRRKRNLKQSSANFIRTTIRTSAQKLFPNRKSLDFLSTDIIKEIPTLSPDSGRNSPSDLEDSGDSGYALTKRRLSFSSNE